MTKCLRICLGMAVVLVAPTSLQAAEFDRLEGADLARISQEEGAKRLERLSFPEIEGLPAVLKDSRSAFLVVKTGEGNYTRILATPALHKSHAGDGGAMAKGDAGAMPKAQGGVLPVLVLERFDTFEPGKSGSRLSRGAGLILFDGFQVDLDTGQVVPPGQGGDLEFRREGNAPPALKSLGKAVIFTLSRPIAPAAAGSGPSTGKSVLPGDFVGRFRLHADGRWSGLLQLQVATDRQVTGQFRSEANGTSYPVTGQVSAESPQKAQFTIKFPRTEQEYDAFLWTEGKNVMCGSFTMTDRTFGFFAVREGAKVAPEGTNP